MAKKLKTDFSLKDLETAQKELVTARLAIAGRREKNTNLAKNLRRKIARIKTYLQTK